MPKIPSTQRLVSEDFPGQRDWIQPMFYIINKFIADTITAVNGGIEFEENIQGVEFDYDFIYQSNATTFPQSFLWTLQTPPKAFSVVAAYINNPAQNRNFSSIIIQCAWQLSADNKVQIIDAIRLGGGWTVAAASQLSPGYRYKIRARVTT